MYLSGFKRIYSGVQGVWGYLTRTSRERQWMWNCMVVGTSGVGTLTKDFVERDSLLSSFSTIQWCFNSVQCSRLYGTHNLQREGECVEREEPVLCTWFLWGGHIRYLIWRRCTSIGKDDLVYIHGTLRAEGYKRDGKVTKGIKSGIKGIKHQ